MKNFQLFILIMENTEMNINFLDLITVLDERIWGDPYIKGRICLLENFCFEFKDFSESYPANYFNKGLFR